MLPIASPAASPRSTTPPGNTQAPANEPRSRGRSASSTSTPRSPSRSSTTVAAQPAPSIDWDGRSVGHAASAYARRDDLRIGGGYTAGMRRARTGRRGGHEPRAARARAEPRTDDPRRHELVRAARARVRERRRRRPRADTCRAPRASRRLRPGRARARHPQPRRPHRVARRVRAHDGCPGPRDRRGALHRRRPRWSTASASRPPVSSSTSSRRPATRPTRCASCCPVTARRHRRGRRCSDGSVLTGDTILGRGTTIISDPDGALGPYLESLERLRALGTPGPVVALYPATARCCPTSRRSAAPTSRIGPSASTRCVPRSASSATTPRPQQVTDLVYADTDASVRVAAEASVRAQLRYLRGTA